MVHEKRIPIHAQNISKFDILQLIVILSGPKLHENVTKYVYTCFCFKIIEK